MINMELIMELIGIGLVLITTFYLVTKATQDCLVEVLDEVDNHE